MIHRPTRQLSARRLGLLAWGLGLMLTACGGDNAQEVVFDFARMLPLATVQIETARIDFGDPDAAAFLGSSWTHGDQAGTFLWAMGERSEVRFHVHRKRALTLRARARAFSFTDSPEQRVTVWVNDIEVATLTLGEAFAEHRIAVPEEAVRAGENELVLAHSFSRSPAAAGLPSNDRRPLAAAWDSLLIDDVVVHQGDPEVREDAGSPTLVLPSSVRLDYYLRLFDDSELVLDRLTPRGSMAAGAPVPRLGVEVLSASGQRTSHELAAVGEGPPARLRLRLSGNGIVRLSFQVMSEPGEGNNVTGLALGRPVLQRGRHAVALPPPQASSGSRPNVLVYVIDTLRADHLGCYGYDRPTSPRLDAFAAEATLFTRAIAQTAWTRPAIASILTGLRPRVHGAIARQDALAANVPTLASLLAAAGYRTAGFTANGNVAPGFGFGSGFEVYEHLIEDQSFEIHRQSDDINRSALSWLDELHGDDAQQGDEPFFLFLHTVDPHAPYTPRQPFRERLARREIDPELGRLDRVNHLGSLPIAEQRALREDLIDLYDGEIAFNDHHFGELLDALEERALGDSTLIILVADHGEEFFDHGHWQHGRSLYQEQIHIPLIVRFPAGLHAGRRVGDLVRQIDLLPTVLRATGVTAPSGVQGRALQDLLDADPGTLVAQPVFSHLRIDGYDQEAVIAERWKLIRYHGRRSQSMPWELYDLAIDSREQESVADSSPVELAYTRGLLDQIALFGPTSLVPGQAEISDQLRERLEALGYLTPRSEP